LLANVKAKDYKKTINTLIIGWNNEAVTLYDRIVSYPALKYEVKGFMLPSGIQENCHYKNVFVIGDLSNFVECIEEYEIEEALIILSPSNQIFLPKIIAKCQNLGINYRVVDDAYDRTYQHVLREMVKVIFSFSDFRIRRVFDFFLSLFLLFLFLPFIIIVSIVIKLESPGSVFYTQQMCGKNGRIFSAYSFRTMIQFEKNTWSEWPKNTNPQVTKIGGIISGTKIDKLPQLLNILQGDMSFIGPRPERPFFVDCFKEHIPMYVDRFKVKPGVIGLEQVTIEYDETLEDIKEKIKADIKYIENASSLKMNLHILWRTIQSVLEGTS